MVNAADGAEGAFHALKRPLAALASERAYLAALKQQANTVLTLRHPGIASVVEVGETSALDPNNPGMPYMVGEVVVGVTLSSVLNHLLQTTRDIPRAFAFTVVGQMLSALAHAHRHGDQDTLFHGDLAPSNIMVGLDGRVVVTDFGVGRARLQLAEPANLALRYRFQYMAPETARDGVADWRSDLYAVGVMLHEMLTFRRLRRGTAPEDVRQQVVAGTWPALESLGIPTDDGLNNILAKALQDHPASRYQSAEQFMADMAPYVQMRNLVVAPEHITQMMAVAFPTLPAREDEARTRTRALFSGDGPAAAEDSLGEPQPLTPGFTPPPQTSTDAIRRRAAAAPNPVVKRLFIGVGTLVLVTVGALVAINAMRVKHHGGHNATDGPTRDLTQLVGGRTALFWSERLASFDKAIAVARAAGREPELAVLEARRADLLRKAAALGLSELVDSAGGVAGAGASASGGGTPKE